MAKKDSSRVVNEKIIEYLGGIFATREHVSSAVRTGFEELKAAVRDDVIRALSRDLWATGIDQIVRFLTVADEVTITTKFVAPLFQAMGYERVRADPHQHRALEFGQDIREMKLRLPSGQYLYFVAQVKKHNINSSVKKVGLDVEAILLQLEKSLEKRVFDYDVGLEVRPDHAYLVCLGRVSKDARVFLEERISAEKRRRILILDQEDLVSLCKQYGLALEAQTQIRAYLHTHRGR